MAGRLEVVDGGKLSDSASQSRSSSRISSGQRARPIRTGSATNSRSSTPLGSGQSTPVRETQLVSVRRRSEMSTVDNVTNGAASINLYNTDDDDEELAELMNLRSDSGLSSKSKSSQPPTANRNQSSTQSHCTQYNGIRRSESSTSQSAIKSNTQTSPNSRSQPASGAVQDNSSSSGDESESEVETRKAPNQLMMEFLDCVMNNDLDNAQKLCKMILIYEPTNDQALKFLPLLQQKKEIDARPPDTDSEESGESEEDDSDTESSEDDSDENSESEEDEQTTTNNERTCAANHS